MKIAPKGAIFIGNNLKAQNVGGRVVAYAAYNLRVYEELL
jgi:hypothetical protein